MGHLSNLTIIFIRNSLLKVELNSKKVALQTLSDATDSIEETLEVLCVPRPNNYKEWQTLFSKSNNHSCNRYVWLWLLGRLSELGEPWACAIEELTITNKGLYELPDNIGRLQNLTLLDVSYNQLEDLPKSILEMDKLRRLYINDNEFTFLPDWIAHLKLDLLYAVGNPLRQIPRNSLSLALDEGLWLKLHDQLKACTKMRSILLQSIPFPTEYKWIGKQKRLMDIEISNCMMWILPSSLWHCTRLRSLKIIECPITEIGDGIRKLSELRQLVVEATDIKTLPKSIVDCTSLTFVEVSCGELSRFPPPLQHVTPLEYLDLRLNSISKIPKWISKLQSLRTLQCSGNHISVLPKELGDLSTLLNLHLSANNLTEIPDWMYRMTHLRRLHIRDNDIPIEQIWRLQCALPNCVIQF